jgi:MGT family glycosyltransferase
MDRVLVMTVRELDDPDVVLPANMRYVGPALEEPSGAEVAVETGDRPLVLVSFSTSNMDQRPALQNVLDGLSDLPVSVVLTTGSAVAADQLDLPANATAYQHLPHADVLPRAALVVTHSGHGTVVAALAHGVPLVCMPMGRDQHYVASRVAAVGAGQVVDATAPPEAIRAAALAVLGDAGYRRGAATMRDAITAATGEDAAVRELERLAGSPTG